ncbi:M4 family metallopeptidase [Hymenobacter norwichensis]|uniref:M4 family metallopeptidase n=1 Tax=Hymenobacter norwichensis TaxID=223903 RepID=UPI0003B61A1D
MSLIANSSCQFGNQVNTWYNGNNILGTWWDSSRNRYQLKDYCRTSYILTKYSDGNGSSDWDNQNSYYIEASGSEGSPQNTNWNWDFKARSAASAHFGMQTAHYYFKTTFNRNGAYGDGRELRVLVNNYRNNAFYDMYNGNDYITVGRNYDFGPADERSFAELDVMAHEFTHGVVRGSANLQLSGESFALNESFADIFGEMTERLHTGQHNWTVLQGIGVPRVMAEEEGPSFAGLNQPAQIYQGRGWDFVRAEPHQNGGVQNRWFYFLSVGTGPRDFNVTVNGIGEEKAQRIAYRSLTRYLNSTSDYNHARVSAIQAATDIYGACSAEVTATTNAWAAVGLGAAAPEFCAAEITGQRRFCTEDGTSVYNEYRVQASPGATKTWSNSNGLFDFSPLGQTDYTVLSQVPDYDEETTLSVYIEFPANPSANVWRNLTINTEQCRVQCRICPEEAQRALSVDESTKQGMTLYPNPADRSITVDFTSASVSARTLNVSDMLGRVLYTQQVPIGQKSVLLDVFQLPAGSFILSVSTPKGTLTKRFLISR